ncbi:MAG: helix-turn-helix transcriptional regulator [Endozoicomonas sp.]
MFPIKVTKELNPAALNTEQAAKYIGTSKSELDKSRISGDLGGRMPPQFFRIGKKIVRYRVVDLQHWLEEQQTFCTIAQESEQTIGKKLNSAGQLKMV